MELKVLNSPATIRGNTIFVYFAPWMQDKDTSNPKEKHVKIIDFPWLSRPVVREGGGALGAFAPPFQLKRQI